MEGRVKIETPKKSLLDLKPIEFEVEKEVWNRYRLEDDAILKTKFVLINVFAEKDFEEKVEKIEKGEKNVKVGFEFQSSNVVGVTVPLNLLGEPSNQQYPLQELEASVIKDEMDFETITESWNIYKLEGGIILKVRNSPIRVRRTNKFDSRGIPIYLVDFVADVKFVPKK
jgi:hypothetical protein